MPLLLPPGAALNTSSVPSTDTTTCGMSFWFRYVGTSTGSASVPLYLGNSGANGWGVVSLTGNRLQGLAGGVSFLATTAQYFAPGVWHHVVFQKSTNWQMYKDGTVGSAQAATALTPTGSVATNGGGAGAGGGTIEVCDLAIWERALSVQEINFLRDGGSPLSLMSGGTGGPKWYVPVLGPRAGGMPFDGQDLIGGIDLQVFSATAAWAITEALPPKLAAHRGLEPATLWLPRADAITVVPPTPGIGSFPAMTCDTATITEIVAPTAPVTQTPTEIIDGQILALDSLRHFQRWDESITDTFAGLIPNANLYGLAQSAPVGPGVASGSKAVVLYGDNYGSGQGASTTDVPTIFASDDSEKTYYYGKQTAVAVATDFIMAADTIRVVQARVSHAGTITKVLAYVDGDGTGTGSQVCRAVVYDDNAGTPGTLLATSDEVTVTDGQADGWIEFTFATPPAVVVAGKYWYGIHVGGNTNTIRIGASVGGGNLAGVLSNADTYADGASSTWVGTASSSSAPIMSVEVTASPTPRSADFSAHPKTVYIDSLDTRYSHGEALLTGINVNSPFSHGGWVKFTNLPSGSPVADSWHGIWGYSNSIGQGDLGWGLLVGASGQILFYRLGQSDSSTNFQRPGHYVETAAGVVTTNTWYNIICRANGATLEIWIDGVLIAQVTDATLPASASYGAYYGYIPMDYSISGATKLLRGYLHRTWYAQEYVTDDFIAVQQDGDDGSAGAPAPGTTLSAMTCDVLTIDASVCDTGL